VANSVGKKISRRRRLRLTPGYVNLKPYIDFIADQGGRDGYFWVGDEEGGCFGHVDLEPMLAYVDAIRERVTANRKNAAARKKRNRA